MRAYESISMHMHAYACTRSIDIILYFITLKYFKPHLNHAIDKAADRANI